MTVITDAKNARYGDDGIIMADVRFDDLTSPDGTPLYLPYISTAHDSADFGPQLYSDLKSGKYGEVKPFTVTPEMLTAAKETKHAEINAWRDMQENGRVTCMYNGNTYDADKESKYRIDNVIEAGGLPDGVKWTDANNNDIALSLSDLKALQKIMVVAMVVQGGEIHERQRQMKESVDAMTDYKAVQNYVVGWPVTEAPKT
ncbi:hypothetical protein DOE59_16360 [Salmonella enterica subsp. diarizonae serovar 48:i:z]|uniref:DUF4376 domain-containing protein n=1 Tax=Salmonella enterica subsp. diarizonae serovar 48:i:z TaxID=1192842 RepID=A0A7U5YHF4_SALDZ|nr:DUF4376 domain-containing protein [Salmonella enterica]EAW1261837.1 DUF4376 domain-containing protein [Salmonella enterica subsp. diarizonae]AXC72998.1 hypothetical protein DOE59_16360 [Salmonella enterica subsp. diarizonae serovar 48:i:z]EEG1121480.1 DUF4376 domain-containing protein [Salmonella enterica subsp. diarizonae]EKK4208759.1 DUF4376 domain-containing protein [Salmonella enterica]ELY5675657.1 DUF4376 domain-containing protein [Salmonella enterica]